MRYRDYLNRKILTITTLVHFILSFTLLQFSYLDSEFGNLSKIFWRVISYPLLVWLIECNVHVLLAFIINSILMSILFVITFLYILNMLQKKK